MGEVKNEVLLLEELVACELSAIQDYIC
jgi:hypothetical protein